MANDTTQVSKKEISQDELNELLGTPGPSGENIMNADEQKPNVFTRKNVDLKFLDKNEPAAAKPAATTAPEGQAGTEGGPGTTGEPAKPVDNKAIVDEVTDPDFDGTKQAPAKGSVAETIKALVKKGKLVPFDDDKPLEDYTTKDFEELLDANFTEKENKIRQEAPAELFGSLPEELQVAAKYVMDGGKDIKGLFKALAQAEEVLSMDATDPKNHEGIVRQFLTTTGFGTAEEIDEEIAGLRDRDELEKKAGQFKPKLDKMQQAIIGQKLAEQEDRQKKQSAAAKEYVGSIYKVLEPGDLNGVKMDRKTQELLYGGLIQSKYPSITGKSTNLLGHLLEKYQYVEPDHTRIAEALWLLADPEGYKTKLMEKGKNSAVEKTVRMLKTEEANRTSGAPLVEKDEATQRRVPRTNQNFFKR